MGELELPEHDKLKALNGANQTVGEFLEWLEMHGYAICRDRNEHRPDLDCKYWPTHKRRDQLIADFFEIDSDKLEQEKRAILEALAA